MSFGGFGSNNNTGSTFGGFGANNSGGFGANNNTSTGNSLFGGNTAATGGGGFGFGSNNNNATSAFGASKPAFGASATNTNSTGLFGSNTASATGGFGSGGGFGSNINNAGGTSGFGSSAGGGLFGSAAKPAATGFGSNTGGTSLFGGSSNTGGFGSTTNTNTTSNPFGGSSNATGGFGSNTTSGGFGATNTNTTGSTFGGFGASGSANNSNNGTAAVPFQATTEKDGATSSTSAYQSVTFQEPYKNRSFEELRTEDYMQGRRYGNTNGQAGSFGSSTGFGGVNNNNNNTSSGGLFGSNTGTTGGFGNNTTNNASSGFGNNTGGGLFGANKPATTSLFGQPAAPAATTGGFGASTTGNTSGGLFGNTGGSGFGANTSGNTGGGLFGNSNNTTSGFGATNNNTTTSNSLFGGNNNAANQNKPSLFGSTTNTPTTGGGLFGQPNNAQPQNSAFGASTNNNASGGLFGSNNAAKPAFGSGFGQAANAGTGFGATNTNTGTSLFGNSTANNATGSSLFGNNANQNKPAATSLFGGNNSASTGGGLFGNANNSQPASGGLFGGNTNNNNSSSLFGASKPSTGLFGNTNNNASNSNNNSGFSLFGNSQNQNQNNANSASLFGGNNSTQSNGNSLFGNSTQQSQQTNQLHTSLTVSPYGNDQLFSSLAAPSPPVGPLATPLSGAKPTPKRNQSLLGNMRVNSPVYTPRASTLGRTNGYGLSYSSYGSPGSAFSGSLTPGATSMLKPTGSIGSGLASRLSKSFSTNNLRGDGTSESGSLLRPGALTSSSSRYGSGSMRKLKIDRSLREDLFGTPPKQVEVADDGRDAGKKVNFEVASSQPAEKDATPSNSNALVVRHEDDERDNETTPKSHAPPRKTGTGAQEMEQINHGSGLLASVAESSLAPRSTQPAEDSITETAEPGAYWAKPSIDHLKKMSRSQLQKLGKFTVGRYGVGKIEFGPCDLTSVPLDDICGNIVQLNPRSATVYLDENDKPPMGQALNVPSTISLEHSWPRSHGGKNQILTVGTKAYDKHIARLSRIGGTHFVSYAPETGVWTFTVEHFTTYGLDDDDEDEEVTAAEKQTSSVLSDVSSTPVREETAHSINAAMDEMDDTFQFKLDGRSQLSVPGALDFAGTTYNFDEEPMQPAKSISNPIFDDMDMDNDFSSSGGPVQPPSPQTIARLQSSEDEADEDDLEHSIPGAFIPEPKGLRSVLKPSMAMSVFASPEKFAGATWEEELQRTMSPKKRDRLALKDLQKSILKARDEKEVMDSPFKQSMLGQSAFGQSYLAQKSAKKSKLSGSIVGTDNALNKSQAFTTSMDIMNSLWADEKAGGKKASAGSKGFEFPHFKKPRLSTSDEIDEEDFEFHNSFKPSFSPDGTLAYAIPGSARQVSGILTPSLQAFVGQHNDVRFARFIPAGDIDIGTLRAQMSPDSTEISGSGESIPTAITSEIMFATLANAARQTESSDSLALTREQSIWQLCSILFDPLEIACSQFVAGIPENLVLKYASRIQMDTFAAFWAQLVTADANRGYQRAKTAEEKALHCLTRNDIRGASEALLGGKNIRLAALVAQLPGTAASRETMLRQINAWRERKDWSEMADSVQTIYSILSGEICVVPGQDGASEDKSSEFCISERFALSWQQSFGLRVFFGGHASIERAVESYVQDLAAGDETVQPICSATKNASESTLMSLLRLHATEADLSALLDPLAVSGSAVDSRLAWQLASILRARSICSLTTDQMDRLTLSFATELEVDSKNIVTAAWILLHISNKKTRGIALRQFLERNGDKIAAPTSEGQHNDFNYLTDSLRIPASMVWAAKAPFAKYVEGDYLQAQWLLKAHESSPDAGHDVEAHDLLCLSVGPEAIIEQDYEKLANLIDQFGTSDRKPEYWKTGAQVYADFLRLHRLSASRKNARESEAALKNLRIGLQSMEENGEPKTLEQRVAMLEMARYGDEFVKERGIDDDRDAAMADVSLYGVGLDLLERYQRALGKVV
ncbi:Hypothetical protein R9X50_00504100 [Acrodontium crateriforme]|uniref:Peptidase S59 domain-containing protein n=1 Tax=Acrodontium crateriforme TaxID=150365 RepID=A0AAQ3M8X3_9PEZI|nr:Hypothetical protein R9X50_00504100 [Acrodontium crateriforme]